MQRLSRFVISSEKQRKEIQSRKKGKRLQRLYAKNDFDYDATKSPFFDGSMDSTPGSFRIQGTVEELEEVCRKLGLSSPDDFAITEEAWEGRRIRSYDAVEIAPPPRSSLSVMDQTCSTWEDSEDDGAYVDVSKHKVTSFPSRSCSFTTTSNEDDTSSATTEPTFSVSSNGRFRPIISSWLKGDLLGRGSFGSVYEAISDEGFFFAVKEVSLLDQGELGRQSLYQLEQEIALLSTFEHDNIVLYYGTNKDERNLYIFLELVNQGSLLSLYQKYDLRVSQISAYTRQILHGLSYLHLRNVVHRDIKCANLLVDSNGSVKLADFGLAKATKLNDLKSCKGTAFWMAPEVVQNQGYGLAADIWSLGCTVLEMLTRQFPYAPLEHMQALFRIGKGIPPPVPKSLSEDGRDFVLKCLQVNPDARPTASQLMDHPFVRRPVKAF